MNKLKVFIGLLSLLFLLSCSSDELAKKDKTIANLSAEKNDMLVQNKE